MKELLSVNALNVVSNIQLVIAESILRTLYLKSVDVLAVATI